MKLQLSPLSRAFVPVLLGLCALVGGCKDDDPCDPDQVEKNGQCYPVQAAGGSAGTSASETGGAPLGGAADTGEEGGGPNVVATPFGTPCEDQAGSTDCGGDAPVCADLTPLGQSVMCTQIDCVEGEANAGVCPDGFNCFAVPSYPSVCIKG